jgi:hypothetical protein
MKCFKVRQQKYKVKTQLAIASAPILKQSHIDERSYFAFPYCTIIYTTAVNAINALLPVTDRFSIYVTSDPMKHFPNGGYL